MTKRTSDDAAIERKLLDLAYTTDVRITAPSLAYHARCSIEDAARVLEDLAAHERVHMDVEDDGTIVYRVPGRPKLIAAPLAPLAPATRIARPHRALSPLLAVVLGVLLPGAGHLYAGRILAGIVWFLVISAGYALIVPGLLLHLFSLGSAAGSAARENRLQLISARA